MKFAIIFEIEVFDLLLTFGWNYQSETLWTHISLLLSLFPLSHTYEFSFAPSLCNTKPSRSKHTYTVERSKPHKADKGEKEEKRKRKSKLRRLMRKRKKKKNMRKLGKGTKREKIKENFVNLGDDDVSNKSKSLNLKKWGNCGL